TVTSTDSFTILPNVTSISPASGVIGATVMVNGSGFVNGSTDVKFNGFSSTSVTFVSPILMRAVVPVGASSGQVSLTTPAGTATGPNFTINASITSFTPTSGTGGASIQITGSGFTGVTAVKFNNVVATSFTVDSDTQITAV